MIDMTKQEKIQRLAQDNPCLCFNIRKASRSVTQVYDDAFREIGYTPSQLMILSAIKELHSATVNELADAVCTDRTTLSRNLNPLRKDSLIRPCNCSDKREKAVMLTEKGKDVLEKASPIWKEVRQRIAKVLGPEQVGHFIKDLNKVVDAVGKA